MDKDEYDEREAELREELAECQRDRRNMLDKDLVAKTAIETEKININLRREVERLRAVFRSVVPDSNSKAYQGLLATG